MFDKNYLNILIKCTIKLNYSQVLLRFWLVRNLLHIWCSSMGLEYRFDRQYRTVNMSYQSRHCSIRQGRFQHKYQLKLDKVEWNNSYINLSMEPSMYDNCYDSTNYFELVNLLGNWCIEFSDPHNIHCTPRHRDNIFDRMLYNI